LNKYKCLKRQLYELEGYSIIPLREQDIFSIMQWRNEQIIILRQNELLTHEKQQKYYNEVIKKTFITDFPEQILFSYILKNILIGYGGLVHINWQDKRGEVSFLLQTERAQNDALYNSDFIVYLNLIKKIAFEDLGFNRLHSEAYAIKERELHIKILEQNGFKREGIIRKHIQINSFFYDAIIHGCLREEYFI